MKEYNIKKIHVWSDGAGSQFKNRFNIWWLAGLKVSLEWNFYCSCHGKNPSDQGGGNVKTHLFSFPQGHENARSRDLMMKYLNETFKKVGATNDVLFHGQVSNGIYFLQQITAIYLHSSWIGTFFNYVLNLTCRSL